MESSKTSKSLSDCEKLSIQTEQLSQLVCPVCYEYMKPPIMECEKAHAICELCHELLSQCPLCQGALTSRRSSHLEILSELVLYPCKHCRNRFSLDEITSHKCKDDTEEPKIICLIGQVYGKCNWRGSAKDMIEHIHLDHPNNYWTKKENIVQWDYCHLSNIGIQEVYLLDLIECLFIIVQKYDSEAQTLQWYVSCECEKVPNQYVYEIQLYSDLNLDTFKCRNVIENSDNIMMSLPISNEIVIPINKVKEFLNDNFINYKIIIHNKVDIQRDQSVRYYQAFGEVKEVETVDTEVKKSCAQKTCQSFIDFYNFIKNLLNC